MALIHPADGQRRIIATIAPVGAKKSEILNYYMERHHESKVQWNILKKILFPFFQRLIRHSFKLIREVQTKLLNPSEKLSFPESFLAVALQWTSLLRVGWVYFCLYLYLYEYLILYFDAPAVALLWKVYQWWLG